MRVLWQEQQYNYWNFIMSWLLWILYIVPRPPRRFGWKQLGIGKARFPSLRVGCWKGERPARCSLFLPFLPQRALPRPLQPGHQVWRWHWSKGRKQKMFPVFFFSLSWLARQQKGLEQPWHACPRRWYGSAHVFLICCCLWSFWDNFDTDMVCGFKNSMKF